MKYILAFALALITSIALADARIEAGPNGYNDKAENKAHFPFDNNDTDNEFYSPSAEISTVQYNGGSSAKAEYSMRMSLAMLPADFFPVYGAINIVVSNETTGEQCTIEANGTTYKADVWKTTITSSGGSMQSRELRMVTECFNGVAQ